MDSRKSEDASYNMHTSILNNIIAQMSHIESLKLLSEFDTGSKRKDYVMRNIKKMYPVEYVKYEGLISSNIDIIVDIANNKINIDSISNIIANDKCASIIDFFKKLFNQCDKGPA